jgi:FkbM family methyltransferase
MMFRLVSVFQAIDMPYMRKKIVTALKRCLPNPWLRCLRRRYYLRVVKNYSENDWEWTPFIKPLITAGSQVLDVGANVGYLSGLFARWVGDSGKIVSVEPIPATYDALSSSMQRLFPGIVTTLQCCLSDAPGVVTMSVPEYEGGGENYYESRIIGSDSADGLNQHQVRATTLDHIAGDLDLTPAFVKIDVEGHELAVIRGGLKFISQHHPPLLIEVAGDPDQHGGSAAQLFGELASLEYVPCLIKNGKLLKREPGDKSIDYLFLHASSRGTINV